MQPYDPSEFIGLVQSAFSSEGVLARNTSHFQPRQGQTDMALAVAHVLQDGGSLVVEAGTGVGKTFAYLVPALLSGERVLLSTATKTLQDQLFSRDLPQLVKVLNLPVKIALLKGRSSYLCQQRLQTHAREHNLSDKGSIKTLSFVREWAKSTVSGDLAELGGLEERSPLWPLLTSSRENCLGSQCPEHKACFVNAARKQALSADVVVINHHLFFADLAVKESGMAELLPSVRVVIFDEAHQLNETGTQFLGEQLSIAQLLDLVRDILASGLTTAAGLCDWQSICSELEKAVRDFRLCIGNQAGSARLRWTQAVPEGIDSDEWMSSIQALHNAFDKSAQALDMVSELAPEFPRLSDRVKSFKRVLKHFASTPQEDQVRWVEIGQMARLVEAPLDIALVVQEKMLGLKKGDRAHFESLIQTSLDQSAWDQDIDQNTDQESTASLVTNAPVNSFGTQELDTAGPSDVHLPRSWIFTSATLGNDDTLSWFTKPCGLGSSKILQVQSPFDYPNQALLYIPKAMVKPSDPKHSEEVSELAKKIIDRLGGRTLILTTTNRALKSIGDLLAEYYASNTGNGEIEVLVQGQYPKRFLMERFRSSLDYVSDSPDPSQPKGCVLVATASFWEGFDVPGDALQAVIIDKLPFPPPGDPLVEARCNRIEKEGGSAFNEYSVPEVAVALKQGAGRLIRRESDKGVLVICDSRLMSTGYGRRLIKSLPPMKHEEREQGLLEFLEKMRAVENQN